MKTITPQSPVETLYREGRKTFIELVPDGGARLDALFHTAPALGELAVGVVYGYLHSRPGLDPRLQEAAIFAAIVAAGLPSPPPPAPRAIVMAFCDSVRRGQPSFPVDAEVVEVNVYGPTSA